MQNALNNFVSNSLFYFIVVIVAWKYVIKALNKSAPAVTSAAKEAAAKKALSMLSRLFK